MKIMILNFTFCNIMFVLFLGHYIVLCGYNKTERLVYYKNPAIKKCKSLNARLINAIWYVLITH